MSNSKNVRYYRKGNKILNTETGDIDTYASINKAKHASAQLQIKLDGRLGAGSVVVLQKNETLPTQEVTTQSNVA